MNVTHEEMAEAICNLVEAQKRYNACLKAMAEMAKKLKGEESVVKEETKEAEKVTAEEGTSAEVKEETKPEKAITLAEVRTMLASLSASGKTKEVKDLITRFGADKLSEIPVEQYGDLMREAAKLNA